MSPDELARLLAPRMPRSAWEGWFWIAIPAAPSPVRWAKVHVFASDPTRGAPIAAVEGLTAERELCSWIATADSVDAERATPAADAIIADGGVSVRGALDARRDEDRWRLTGGALSIAFSPRDRIVWARLPRVLTYVGVHCNLDGKIRDDDVRGLGVLEHAWGASVPFRPTRLVRGPWHWDVLSLATESEPADVAALAVTVPGLGTVGVHARGRLPGTGQIGFSRFVVRVLEHDSDDALARTPRRWTGELHGRAGDLSYEAVASTPVARPAPGVAFLGFDFEGEWRRNGGAPEHVQGRGFAEHGCPARLPAR